MSYSQGIIMVCSFLLLSSFSAVKSEQSAKVAQDKTEKKMRNELKNKEKFSAYLFVYFTASNKDEEEFRFALSDDGYNYKALNNNQPILNSEKISSSGGIRDPHIMRAVDGKTFYMVATDMVAAKGWNSNRGMILLKSTNLIDWKSNVVNIPTAFPEFKLVDRVWAPQTIYDPVKKQYMVYWSMRSGNEPDKIYYAYANKDFTNLETEPKQLFYNPQNKACIDGDIIYSGGKYHLFYKSEDDEKGIKQAISDKLTEGYVAQDKILQQTTDLAEGSCVFKLNNSDLWILMYDVYQKGRYQFARTNDLENFKVIDQEVTMDFQPRHGTVMPITSEEAKRLRTKWLTTTDVFQSARSQELNHINIVVDAAVRKVVFPVKPTTNLEAFNPDFNLFPELKIRPEKSVDFSKGAVKYTVKIGDRKAETYMVEAVKNHNPVLNGYYADPEVLYVEKTGKFYIYPTSDGFTGWSGTYFKCFSSDNLVDWNDHGVILQLGKDVNWASRNAWAPCIVEKKINGQYKYFYYFSAAQKIGVAVADNPTGPFVDLGKVLIDTNPKGVKGGQNIDPDVFTDPKSGKSYLYWGNGFMAGAELNDEMTSIKQETVTALKPDSTYREGTYVFYRNGKYYFMWSEDDTRSENYRVRYATSDSPLGTFTIPQKNLVIAKDKALGIYGTGHNSVLQIPGRDEWYIVYHRFNYPKGITQGKAAGYNREVCIDKMEFNVDGSVKQVAPTHKGIAPVKL